jgi:hypothetical protein
MIPRALSARSFARRAGGLTVLVAAAAVLAAPLAAPAGAQVPLREATTLAVSNQGLYVVPSSASGTVNVDEHAFRVATPADFGLDQLTGARLDQVAGTGVVMVGTTSSPAGPGHLHRVTLAAGPGPAGARVAALETLAEGDVRDVAYSAAMDVLYVLDAQQGAVLGLPDPAHAGGRALAVVNDSLPAGAGARSLALLPGKVPFALLVLDDTAFWRVPVDGSPAQVLYGNTVLELVTNHPWLDEWYTLHAGTSTFGLPLVNLLTGKVFGALQANLAGPGSTCEPATGPVSFDCDPRADGTLAGLVVIANAVAPCWSGVPQGKNHVLRFPIAQALGTTGFPVLHTPTPVAGIGGTKPDVAFVRLRVPEIASVGTPSPAPGSPFAPEAGFSIVAGVPRVTLKGGPPSAPVTLAVRVVHEGGPVAFDPPVHRVADALIPATTLPGGGAFVEFDLPAAQDGGGRRLALQWLLPDGSLSQKLLLVVGRP